MPALFAVGQHEALAEVCRHWRPDTCLLVYLEDIYDITSPRLVAFGVPRSNPALFTFVTCRGSPNGVQAGVISLVSQAVPPHPRRLAAHKKGSK